MKKEQISFPIRLNRYLLLKGVCSRRQADRFIEKGFIFVNGEKAIIGQQVGEYDEVTWSENIDRFQDNYIYLAYHKPVGVVTVNPEKGQKCIKDVFKFNRKVYPIGRLDMNSRGLILMSNDGRIVDRMLNPKFYHEKEYIVKVNRNLDKEDLRQMANGVILEGKKTRKAKITQQSDKVFNIVISEGRKRQIRRMCQAFEYEVVDLLRVRVMNIKLGNLKANKARMIEGEELEELLKSLGGF